MAKKAYIGCKDKKSALPAGYTQVDYIESSGTQYIDADFKPNQNTKVVMDVQSVGLGSSNGQSFFGVRHDASGRYVALWNKSAAQYMIFYKNTSKGVSADRLTDRLTVTMDKNTLYVGDSVTVSIAYSEYQVEGNLYLFATNYNGKVDYRSVIRVYSCQIYDDGTLVRSFIPCSYRFLTTLVSFEKRKRN